ncbi:MAG: hypothetical protein KatS3mg117_0585 [Geminicoccaceae bacterium]|nr:MAG: hypothetical protein KatS3mg117_0585 [Geminicoccaceae bacterium]
MRAPDPRANITCVGPPTQRSRGVRRSGARLLRKGPLCERDTPIGIARKPRWMHTANGASEFGRADPTDRRAGELRCVVPDMARDARSWTAVPDPKCSGIRASLRGRAVRREATRTPRRRGADLGAFGHRRVPRRTCAESLADRASGACAGPFRHFRGTERASCDPDAPPLRRDPPLRDQPPRRTRTKRPRSDHDDLAGVQGSVPGRRTVSVRPLLFGGCCPRILGAALDRPLDRAPGRSGRLSRDDRYAPGRVRVDRGCEG